MAPKPGDDDEAEIDTVELPDKEDEFLMSLGMAPNGERMQPTDDDFTGKPWDPDGL
jgi:hypothetical protein